jgi:hypothetical protein
VIKLPEPRTAAKVTGMPKVGVMLCVGHPKSGKTWFAASAPDSILVELEEHGADRVPWGRIVEVDSGAEDALDKFAQVMDAVMSDDAIKVVTIDSIDQWAKIVQEDIVRDWNKRNPNNTIKFLGEAVKGVDNLALWGDFGNRVRTITDGLKRCDKLVILVAHCKAPEKDSEGRVITPAGINISGKGGAYIAAQAEMIGHVGVRDIANRAQHYITFRSDSNLAIWRSRVSEVHGKEILLDKENPWGSFAAAFEPAKTAPAEKPAKEKKNK